ncbi:protoheme IX farnesyltransferase [bacterium]|jgi:protoheme IX farnesyltransferase|nr:protoheme IX farnesyltransferase [bacterium]
MNSRKSQLKAIKELSKSGIVTLVLISVFAGYLIGQPGETDFQIKRMALTLIGVLFLASGSSALNQIQERDIDAQMPRTAQRPLPSGTLSLPVAILFTLASLLAGLSLLAYLDIILFALGGLALISYNGLYTLWWKRKWAYAAVPGAIPGALPILMGHLAATQDLFHPGGIYLFFILFFWQMPHFWALALRYQEDYQKGGFPVLPIKHGPLVTLKQIGIWCVAYLGLALIAPLFLKVRWIYLVPTLLMGSKVALELLRFAKNPEGKLWLRFFLWVNFSLVVFLGAAALDLWSIYLPIPHLTR